MNEIKKDTVGDTGPDAVVDDAVYRYSLDRMLSDATRVVDSWTLTRRVEMLI